MHILTSEIVKSGFLKKYLKEVAILPSDGIILLENWTYFLTYFDSNTNKITEKYIKMDCNCDLIYFGDEDPTIKNKLN